MNVPCDLRAACGLSTSPKRLWSRWAYRRVLRGLRHPSVCKIRKIQHLCHRNGWHASIIEETLAHVLLARTPWGLVFGLATPEGIEPRFYMNDIYPFALTNNLDTEGVRLWHRVLTHEHAKTAWSDLGPGCTPIVGPLSSAHERLQAMQAWTEAQLGLEGWTQSVGYLPEAVSLESGTPMGLGSCMLVLRQGRLLALVATRQADMHGWIDCDQPAPFSACRLIALYDMAPP